MAIVLNEKVMNNLIHESAIAFVLLCQKIFAEQKQCTVDHYSK